MIRKMGHRSLKNTTERVKYEKDAKYEITNRWRLVLINILRIFMQIRILINIASTGICSCDFYFIT